MKRTTVNMRRGEGHQSVITGNPVDYLYIVDEERFRKGENIVTEGSFGNWIWVVLDGSVEVSKNAPKGPVILARLGQGCFIGTLISLFYGDNRRSATVTAVEDVQLGLLDHQRLAADFAGLSKDFLNILASYTRRLFKITDKAVGLPENRQEISQLIKEKKLFMETGRPMSDIFRILQGEASVVRGCRKGLFPLLKLDKRDFFGPVPFMDIKQEFHNAQIFVSNDLKIEKVDIAPLHREYDQMPVALKNLIHDAGKCIYRTTNMVSPLHLF